LKGKYSYDTFKVEAYRITGNTIELMLEPNDFEYIDVFHVKAFPSVSFFIAIQVD
jgi:hypothetical protein